MSLSANQKGLIVVGASLALITGAFFIVRRFLYPNAKQVNSNFLDLQENIGIKPNGDIVIAKFNEGENKAQFYSNDRFFIFDKNNNILNKGKYEDGGKKITFDSGKIISSNSVWKNLLDSLK